MKKFFKKFKVIEPNEENLDNSSKLEQQSKNNIMTGDSEVTLLDGERELSLIFNETLASLKADNTLKIKLLVEPTNYWDIHLHFIHKDDIKDLDSRREIKDKEIHFHLNKWYSDASWIENRDPYSINSKGNTFTIHIKIKTMANTFANHRTTTITIWKETLKQEDIKTS